MILEVGGERQIERQAGGRLPLPSPWQSGQTDCICWTIPGPSGRIMILTPDPLHCLHWCIAPALPPWLQIKSKYVSPFKPKNLQLPNLTYFAEDRPRYKNDTMNLKNRNISKNVNKLQEKKSLENKEYLNKL